MLSPNPPSTGKVGICLGFDLPRWGKLTKSNSYLLANACKSKDLIFSTNHWSNSPTLGKNSKFKPDITRTWGVGA